MKNVLFLVYTEYHLLVITSIILEYFNDTKKYKIILLLPNTASGKRFKIDINWNVLPVSYVHLPVKERDYNYNPLLGKMLNKLLNEKYEYYITFHEHTAINNYITSKLSGTNTKICLAPEGTRPYITIGKLAIPSRTRFTLENYWFLRSQKLVTKSFQFVGRKHGYLNENTEIWVERPEKYPNLNNKFVKKIKLFSNKSHVEAAQKLFRLDVKNELSKSSDIIFYLNHWFVVQEIYEYEIKVIKQILRKYPHKRFIIKLHPNTPDFQIVEFGKIPNVEINKSTIPAELFVVSLENSLVISFWSASLMINNSSCNFYWLHKVLRKDNPKMKWWDISNPTNHILEIDKLDEL